MDTVCRKQAVLQTHSAYSTRRCPCPEAEVTSRKMRQRQNRLDCIASSRITRMRCPYCNFTQDRVVDSRESKDADSIRRRRECERCNKRFTTYERIDEIPYMVVKKDGRRERFERAKVLNGVLRACEKRPVPSAKLEGMVDEIEAFVVDSQERERTTSEIGELIMDRLKTMDTVAYIRFASVYRDFTDVLEFKEELEQLLHVRDAKKKK